MNNWTLLRIMIMKEIRTTFRERSQIAGVAIGALMMVIVAGGAIYQTRNQSHHGRHNQHMVSTLARSALGTPALPPQALRWAIIGAGAFIGFFFSMGYLISAVLACFVGEKEAKTLEILLASPLSDSKLFGVKCVSTLLPSVAIGFFFIIAIAAGFNIFVPQDLAGLPAVVLFSSVALTLPILILVQLFFLGLGAAISLKAETMKGASQMFGVVFMVLFFGVGYGSPFLLMWFPALRARALHWLMESMKLNFAAQYGLVLILLCILAGVFMTAARLCFQRDRMLS